MEIVLINPPLIPASELSPPVGLCTLAFWLKKHGHKVSILDLDLELKTASGESRVSILSILADRVRDRHPAIVGFTSMYNNSLQAEQLIKFVKSTFPEIWTVAGGPHFGAQGNESLKRIPELDFVIEREGELGLNALLNCLENDGVLQEVPNLVYRQGGSIVANPQAGLLDLAVLEPIWENIGSVIDLDRYAGTIAKSDKRRAIYIEAGRGCPYNCTFCAPAQFWDRKYRVKSVETIISEMKFLKEGFGYDSFLLIHDLLTVDRKFIDNFTEALIEADCSIEWMANARIDIDLSSLLPKMKKSGCWKLFYGVESASERIQGRIEKRLKKDAIINTISHLVANDIEATCSFVIGFSDESEEELSETISLGSQLRLLGSETVQYHRLRFFPPAPLSQAGLDMSFDIETLKLEFPFPNILDEEIDAIKSSPAFYSGYFAPNSSAGLPSQLSQIELFFQQAVSTAPITIKAIASIARENLVSLFYRALSTLGEINRYSIDWVSNDMVAHWDIIFPYLDFLCSNVTNQAPVKKILRSIISYEKLRLDVVVGKKWIRENAVFSTDGCLIVAFPLDIFEIINRLKADKPIADIAMEEIHVMFLRSPEGDIVAFQGSMDPETIE